MNAWKDARLYVKLVACTQFALFFLLFFLQLVEKAEGHRQNNEQSILSSVSIADTSDASIERSSDYYLRVSFSSSLLPSRADTILRSFLNIQNQNDRH